MTLWMTMRTSVYESLKRKSFPAWEKKCVGSAVAWAKKNSLPVGPLMGGLVN